MNILEENWDDMTLIWNPWNNLGGIPTSAEINNVVISDTFLTDSLGAKDTII